MADSMKDAKRPDYPPYWFVALCVFFCALLCLTLVGVVQDLQEGEKELTAVGAPGLATATVVLEALGVLVFALGALAVFAPRLLHVFLVALPPVAVAQRIALMTAVGLFFREGHFERHFAHLGAGWPVAIFVVWEIGLLAWFVGYVVFWYYAYRAYRDRPQPQQVE